MTDWFLTSFRKGADKALGNTAGERYPQDRQTGRRQARKGCQTNMTLWPHLLLLHRSTKCSVGKRRAFTSSCFITDNTEIAGDPCFNGGEIKSGGFLWSFVLAFVWSVCEIMAYVPRGRKK